MKALLVAAMLAAGVPEPSGYWTGPNQGETPASVTGATVIHTGQLSALIKKEKPVLIDVSPAPPPPPDLPPGTVFMAPVHRDIPGSIWLQEAGKGDLSPEAEASFRTALDQLTHGNKKRVVVLYCHPRCWLSWNATKRAVSLGYQHVYWYPDGIEGWQEAGKPVASVEARKP